MYLKKLSIQGFKSFANRTTFEYGRGVTAVVGPNGSGKSNVADAIRWVLGEQSVRLLRAKKQDDVIFSGTSGRSAVGMAEVLLTLDNEDKWLPLDFAEVEVGRRVYRNGDSEYLLNGSRVRLRDILDLLMKGDVGQNSYTIMGQGLVDQVLTMTPDERRGFLDEAADVKRFRIKIKDAQERLLATRENLDKITLIIREIEPQLSRLERQAERAAEHKSLSAELAELLRTYYGYRWADAQNAIIRARAMLDQSVAEHTTAKEHVDVLREQLRTLAEEIRRRRDAIARRDNQDSELRQRVSLAEQNIALDRERLTMVLSRREEVQGEIAALEAEHAAAVDTQPVEADETVELDRQLAEAQQELATARAGLDAAERDYSALRARVRELRDGAEADDRRAGALEADATAAERRLAELERETQQSQARRKQVLVELAGYGRRFAEHLLDTRDAEGRLEDARATAAQTRERLLKVQEEMREYERAGHVELRELDHLEGRLDALRRVQAEHEGVAAGTRNVLVMGHALIEGVDASSLGEAAEVEGVIGLLSRQLRVPPGLELAINAALETRLHAVVIEHESQALRAIELLRTRHQGRAQFLPLSAVRHVYPLNLQKEKGVLGVAAKLVRCDGAFRPLIDTLLGRVIIVEDMETAIRMIKRGLGSVATLDGVYVEPTGVMTGGSAGAEEGVFARHRELEELPGRIEELRRRTGVSNQQVETARTTTEQLARRAAEAEGTYDALRRQLDAGHLERERLRDRLHRHRRDMDAVRARRAEVARENESRLRLIEQSRTGVEQLIARRDERRAAVAGVEAELAVATAAREATLAAMGAASGRQASVEGERRARQAMREQLLAAAQRLSSQLGTRRGQGAALDAEAAVIEARLVELQAELEAANAEHGKFAQDAAPDRDELVRFENHERAIQDELSEAQSALLVVDRKRLDVESDLARGRQQLDDLRIEMEREGLAPDRAGQVVRQDELPAPEADPAAQSGQPGVLRGGAVLDVEATRRRIEEVRRQIRRLGPINEEALEDYRESKERHEFLSSQMADLEESSEQLRMAIAELNIEIRVRFTHTFEVVNRAFGEYFQSFFGGGTASLSLTDPANIAEAGIEIEATPPGKRIKSLSLLSGGERSLTAVALLFALLAANPAPFCVLDEVDAALDEANVGRFATSLAKLSEKTQFLVVTHNRRSIEVADAIYGSSMGRDGVSKVLSLKMADLPQN